MKPFPPLSPDGSRSFPSANHCKGSPEWNHYYVRAVNGEVRLWVNGHEVSGGSDCQPATGHLCLEREGPAGRVPEPADPRTALMRSGCARLSTPSRSARACPSRTRIPDALARSKPPGASRGDCGPLGLPRPRKPDH